jgi:dolichyl-phosphate beta-glucosyltransferase
MVTVSIVLPAFNEGRVIARSLERLAAYLGSESGLPGRWEDWEIVVVDDGSSDGTSRAAREALPGEARLNVLRHETNRGKGAAIAAGAAVARGQVILITDVDLSYAVEDLGAAAQVLGEGPGGCDLVTGDRRHPDSRMDLALSALRHVLRRQAISGLFNLGVRLAYGIESRDTQCGLKGFTRAAAARILPKLKTRRFLGDIEIFLIAGRLGLRTATIPVHLTYLSADSTVHVLRQAPLVAADAVRIKVAQVLGRYD